MTPQRPLAQTLSSPAYASDGPQGICSAPNPPNAWPKNSVPPHAWQPVRSPRPPAPPRAPARSAAGPARRGGPAHPAGQHRSRPRGSDGTVPARCGLLPPPALRRPPQLPRGSARRGRRGARHRRQHLDGHLGPERRRHPHRTTAHRLDGRPGRTSARRPTASSPAAARQSNLQALLLARNAAVAGAPGSLPERLAAAAHLRLGRQPLQHREVRLAARPGGRRSGGDPRRLDAPDGPRRAGARACGRPGRRAARPWPSSPPPAPPTSAPSTRCRLVGALAAAVRRLVPRRRRLRLRAARLAATPRHARRHRARRLGDRRLPQVLLPADRLQRDPGPRQATLGLVSHHADYLNPAAEAGRVPNQVDKSLADHPPLRRAQALGDAARHGRAGHRRNVRRRDRPGRRGGRHGPRATPSSSSPLRCS